MDWAHLRKRNTALSGGRSPPYKKCLGLRCQPCRWLLAFSLFKDKDFRHQYSSFLTPETIDSLDKNHCRLSLTQPAGPPFT
ncbi:hypothetical protein D1AOALGA4SA_4986 [Olavius algarvensis Delta 1 endosymbiont]|nr:hypothetical protein D1AOALGA4SA_4986 [Olavius algarvensis Delta 1 endosymbiont]